MQKNGGSSEVIQFVGNRSRVIKFSLLIDEVRRVAHKHSSAIPDSLGDRLLRKALQLSYAMRTGYLDQAMVEEAEDLLKQDADERAMLTA